MKIKLMFYVAIWLCMGSVCAQTSKVWWNVGVISEGQWNLSKGKTGWMNLLSADMGCQLWKGATFDVSALSTYGVGTPIADDRQGFSNIDADNRGFRLFHAGLSQQLLNDQLTLFVGLKAADEDYFNTDLAGLFTGSYYGGIPVCTENHGISVYPEAALAFHAAYEVKNWTLRESFYHGAPSDRLDEQFRFRPGRDGWFNMGSVMYSVQKDEEAAPAAYTLGYAYSSREVNGQSEFGVWTTVEHPLFQVGKCQWYLLAQGAAELTSNAFCKGFWAGGVVAENFWKERVNFGCAVNRAYYADGHETDVELTLHLPLGKGFSLQPAFHAIRTDGLNTCIGQLRLCYEIGGGE